MIKGIQITGSTNNALLNSFWLLDDQTNETRCLVAKKESPRNIRGCRSQS